MCVKLNSLFDGEMKVYSLFDGEMKVYNGTDVFKHYVDISTKCFNYNTNLETRNRIYCKSI